MYLPRSTPSMSCTPTLTWLRPRCLTILRASAAVLTWRGSIVSPLLAGRRLPGGGPRKPEDNALTLQFAATPPKFGVAATAPSTRARVYAVFRSSDFGHAGRQWRAFHLIVLAAGLLAVALSSVDRPAAARRPDPHDRSSKWSRPCSSSNTSSGCGRPPNRRASPACRDGTARLRWALSGNGLIGLLAVVPIAAVSSGTIHADSDAVPIFCVLVDPEAQRPCAGDEHACARVIANERASLASVLIIFIMVLVTAATLTHCWNAMCSRSCSAASPTRCGGRW